MRKTDMDTACPCTGLTMDDKQLKALGELLAHYSCIERVELLPFIKWVNLNGATSESPIPWGHPAARIRTGGTRRSLLRGFVAGKIADSI